MKRGDKNKKECKDYIRFNFIVIYSHYYKRSFNTIKYNVIPINNLKRVNNSSNEFYGDYYLTYKITPDKNYSDLLIVIDLYLIMIVIFGWGSIDVTNVTGVIEVTQPVQVYYTVNGKEPEYTRDLENPDFPCHNLLWMYLCVYFLLCILHQHSKDYIIVLT